MIVKVCGMTDAANIREVEALGPDLMGFIFYEKSPRYVRCRPAYMPRTGRVGVFVDHPLEYVLDKSQEFGLGYVQLHGSESPELCAELRSCGLKVIKSFSVSSPCDVLRSSAYEGCADMFLFDTRCDSVGGSGRCFDWSLLDAYTGSVPFLLSGGIGPDTPVGEFSHPRLAGYDLNSRFETSPGIKDTLTLAPFILKIKSL